jgi:glycosyltransferase involved in cell wall biosynthesis
VAVVHDWLTGMRGGENVLEAVLDLFPRAEIFTLFHFPGSVSETIERFPIRTSRLQRFSRLGDYRSLLPLFPRAVESWDLRGYDLILSSSHCVAKGVRAEGVPHLCYCHTPMRYIWDRFDDYFPPARMLRRRLASIVAGRLRRWDVRTAAGVDLFVANSRFVRDRIGRYYGREAEVVHPFVDETFLDAPFASAREPYHVVVSALVPYKRVDLAIAGARRAGRRLVVIGGGPLLGKLREESGPGVELLGRAPREVLIDRIGRAQSLILPGVEDFGITPLEAMALGTPVVALGEGGVTESVVEGENGVFFSPAEPGALAAALLSVENTEWDRSRLRQRAGEFTRGRFQRELAACVESVMRR